MADKEKYISKPDFEEVMESESEKKRFLTLYNDDVHTFDYVIDALVEVCEHDVMQAEQCTYIVHYKGKCEVKKGSDDFLKPMRYQLIERGLKATID
jgi:ATP-dependent Clp protease adaptor protein ClpS